uniref:Ribonucleoside triphosphate reductase n=1 Tax=candidate division CPR3 bacterium TaxID=2268181 RepID=A0A7C4M099_UNCC3
MYSKIKKRNGKVVSFDKSKIFSAILKAGLATEEFGVKESEILTEIVFSRIKEVVNDKILKVEEVQDIIENVLLESEYKNTAKAYILYRYQHSQFSDISNSINIDLVNKYLNKADWKVRENSNMFYSLQGLNNYISSEISKNYWLNKIYSEKIRLAHLNGDLHIHDLNFLSVYCVGWDLYDLLIEGFTGVESKVSSKPPRHFRSALGQVVNFFYTLQGEAAGAQAFSNFDTLLCPFIKFDGLSYSDVKQALQEFLFNINIPTRVGFQTPFTNITLDLVVPEYYAKQPVVIGGKLQKENYGDFQKEMDLFNKAFLEVMSDGDASGRVFTFPIPTYNITKDFNWDGEVSKILWDVTGKYGLPYFSNFINSDMRPEDSRSMCCRLRIDNTRLKNRGGGLFGANPLTGSIGVVTINLPRIGYEANNKEEFLDRLEELMSVAKDSLEIKRKFLENLTEKNLYPYTKHYLRNIKIKHNKYWENHFSTIGIVGMNEAIKNLFNKDIASFDGQRFAKKTLDFMKEKLDEFQKETKNNYNLEATPAEGASYRLALIDQKKHSDMMFANGCGCEVENPFYTNSTHLPVNFSEDIFQVLDLQDELQARYSGGTVLHLFVGERITNSDSIKNLVKKICELYKMPYFTISPTFSICPKHGYISGEVEKCINCNSNCEIYSRIVGYLRPINQWNDGKISEFNMRKKYIITK